MSARTDLYSNQDNLTKKGTLRKSIADQFTKSV
jgi:hypothetical protein